MSENEVKHDFVSLRHKMEKERIDENLLLEVRSVRDYFFKAFKLIRNENNFVESKILIEKGLTESQKLEHLFLASELISSISLPIMAYYEFKILNFTCAINYLFDAIGNEEYLSKHGFDLLYYRTIDFYVNIAKVYSIQGSFDKSACIMSETILHLMKYTQYDKNSTIDHDYYLNDTFLYVLGKVNDFDVFNQGYKKLFLRKLVEGNILNINKSHLLNSKLYSDIIISCKI